jgi:endonuclease III
MPVSTVAGGAARREALRARKRPFRIGTVLRRIREVVRPLPKAAMFALAEDGYRTPYQQLVACILSIRTRDEVSLLAARRLFAAAPTAAALAALGRAQIDALIDDTSFHAAKAEQIQDIARAAVRHYGGELPCDEAVLRAFRGVGPKCAHLALGIACGTARISVDIHVHRVTNRWGYVRAPTPERTMAELERKLPARYWVEINALLVPFGKHICTGRLPKCSTCPVLPWCRQVGVERHR